MEYEVGNNNIGKNEMEYNNFENYNEKKNRLNNINMEANINNIKKYNIIY